MKRILLFAAALCCVSLFSCDNEQDNLSPEELEIIKLNELIASQTEFDEEALIEDLLNGVFISKTAFLYKNGTCVDSSFEQREGGGSPLPDPIVFFEDGTCKKGELNPVIPPMYPQIEPVAVEQTWRYDSATRSIITNITSVETKLTAIYTAKILYYKDHVIVWEGNILDSIWSYYDGEPCGDYLRTSGYIDMESRDLYVNTLK